MLKSRRSTFKGWNPLFSFLRRTWPHQYSSRIAPSYKPEDEDEGQSRCTIEAGRAGTASISWHVS